MLTTFSLMFQQLPVASLMRQTLDPRLSRRKRGRRRVTSPHPHHHHHADPRLTTAAQRNAEWLLVTVKVNALGCTRHRPVADEGREHTLTLMVLGLRGTVTSLPPVCTQSRHQIVTLPAVPRVVNGRGAAARKTAIGTVRAGGGNHRI